MQSDAKIVVVGAGISGLAAAVKLSDAGFTNLVVLEARNRIGGRILTEKFENAFYEAGATYTHGVGGETTKRLLSQANLRTTQWDYCEKMRNGHWLIDPNACIDDLDDKIYDEVKNILVDVFVRHNDYVDGKAVPKSTDAQNDNTTQLHYFNNVMDDITKKTKEELKKLKLNEPTIEWLMQAAIRVCMLREFVDSGSASLDDSPAWQFSVYYEPPGGDAVIQKGMSGLLKPLVERLPADCIKFGAEVKKIFWSGHEKRNGFAHGRTKSNEVKIQYKTDEGTETIFADHVVLTLPLGCLKANHVTMFQPSLPQEKINVIERTKMAQVEKVILIYDKPFWEESATCLVLLWDNVSNSSETSCWLKSNALFNVLKNEDDKANILEGWICWNKAKTVAEMTTDEVGSSCTDVFRHFFKNKQIPKPRNVFRSTWTIDPYSEGSYSYPSIHNSVKDFETLERSLPYEQSTQSHEILFAGEATNMEHFSTVHGAFISGEREANKIIQFYKKSY